MATSATAGAVGPGPLRLAKLIAFAAPAALLAGAYYFQYGRGLPPCEMCWWQRYAHMAALAFAIIALIGGKLPDRGRSFVWLAALGILASGLIGGYHAGVEAGLFEGFTQCTSLTGGGSGSNDDLLKAIIAAPIVRCDQVPWSLFGISMAGWNAILSVLGALVVLWLSLKRPPVRI
jgi:disulfide bond formation protein DsbB